MFVFSANKVISFFQVKREGLDLSKCIILGETVILIGSVNERFLNLEFI